MMKYVKMTSKMHDTSYMNYYRSSFYIKCILLLRLRYTMLRFEKYSYTLLNLIDNRAVYKYQTKIGFVGSKNYICDSFIYGYMS